MANYSNLKAAINEVIKANGVGAITGDSLNQVLMAMVNSLGDGYIFMGVATPSTNPGTPDQNVFYLAYEGGTYSNFGALVVSQGYNLLKLTGSTWSVEQLFGVDNAPTAGSGNLVTSGGVQNELVLGAVYDVSAKNPTAGTNNDGKWESLSALLSDVNLSTLIPTSVRKGGMNIKFVQSSDNKYIQARCMAQNFTTDVSQWQGVDGILKVGSANLVESKGVTGSIQKIIQITLNDFVPGGYYSSSDGSYGQSSSRRLTDFIPVNEGEQLDYTIYCNPAQLEVVAFDSNMDIVLASSVAGRASTDVASYTVPSGVSYLRFCEGGSTTRTGEVSFKNSISGLNTKIELNKNNIYKTFSTNVLHALSPSANCQFLYIKTNFVITRAAIKRVYNRADGFRLWLDIYEETHPNTAFQFQINVNWSGIKTGFYEASSTVGPSYVKVGFYLFGEVSDLDSIDISIPVDCVEQDDPNPINDIFDVRNEIGQIISNGAIVHVHWREGRLDYNSGYTGWTSSADYWNSGYIKLPAGNYKVIGNTTPNGRAPMVIKFNNDYTFNSILVAGTSTVASYTFTLNEETIIACNTQATNVSNFRLEKLNEGSLDICENFSDVNNQLYYKGQPIASETSISTLVTDLPVSDGTDIQSGYAYIDRTDRTIKVKA